MVTDAIIQAFLGVLASIVTLIPGGASLDFANNLDITVLGWVKAGNGFLPVSVALTCLVGLLALQLALSGWDLAVWIYHQVWGSD
jgi:hypothetical protein